VPPLSHLTPCISTNPNLYLANSLTNFVRDPGLHRLTNCTKSHVPFLLLKSYQRISPGPRHVYPFRNKVSFDGEELSAPPPNPKMEDHLLSAVRNCLFNIFTSTPYIGGRSSFRYLRTRHAVVTETQLSWRYKIYNIQNVAKWTKNKHINYDQDNKDNATCWMLTPAPHVYPQFVLCSQKVAPCLLHSFLLFKTKHITVSKISMSY